MTRLDKFFATYNRKYFNNTLPTTTVKWADIKHFGQYHCKDWDTFDLRTDKVVATRKEHIIEIGRWSCRNNSIWRSTLLHEMTHLKLCDKRCETHGYHFQREMKRLANCGAFRNLW